MAGGEIIKISDFFSLSIQMRVDDIMKNFVKTQNLGLVILELVQEISKVGINSSKSVILQDDLVNILISSHGGVEPEEIFGLLSQRNFVRFFRKILKKYAKYYINMNKCIDKFLIKEEDELDRENIKACLKEKIGEGVRSDVLLQLEEATDVLTFLDNQRLENDNNLQIISSYINFQNFKEKKYLL